MNRVRYTPPPTPVEPAVDAAEGERAMQQLLLALRVTHDKLSTVRQSVRGNASDGPDDRDAR